MTNRLAIHFPTEIMALESDDPNIIIELSDFCKTELGAYNSTDNVNELTVGELSEEDSNRFNSKLFELGLI